MAVYKVKEIQDLLEVRGYPVRFTIPASRGYHGPYDQIILHMNSAAVALKETAQKLSTIKRKSLDIEDFKTSLSRSLKEVESSVKSALFALGEE